MNIKLPEFANLQLPENIIDINNLILDSLDGEPLEVALYMLKRNLVANMARMAITAGKTETPNIMPEVLVQVLGDDDALVNNTFYVENFAVLRASMTKANRDLAVKAHFVDAFKKEQDEKKKKQYAEAILGLSSSTFSCVTDVIYIAKGLEASLLFEISLQSMTHAGKMIGDL